MNERRSFEFGLLGTFCRRATQNKVLRAESNGRLTYLGIKRLGWKKSSRVGFKVGYCDMQTKERQTGIRDPSTNLRRFIGVVHEIEISGFKPSIPNGANLSKDIQK